GFGRLLAFGRLPNNWGYYSHDGTVSSVQPDRISDQEELAPVFAGENTPVALVPIQHELAIQAFFNDESIHPGGRRGADGPVDGHGTLRDGQPAGARQALLWRVDRVGLAFDRPTRCREADPPSAGARFEVSARHVVVYAQHGEHAVVHRRLRSAAPVANKIGETRERLSEWYVLLPIRAGHATRGNHH